MNEYNELIAAELDGISNKIVTTLQENESFNKRGVATLLMTSAVMLDAMSAGRRPNVMDAQVTSICLQYLANNPGAVHLLLGQLGKTLAMIHLGFFDQQTKRT